MSVIQAFPTLIYRERLQESKERAGNLNQQLLTEIEDVTELDGAGRVWSKENYRNGYTSYASANELHKFSPTFGALELMIDKHVAKFARALDFDLGGRPLHMTTCWTNVMRANSHHGMHIHPLSVISGTYYVRTPPASSAIKFEDPRLANFMASPPKKEPCRPRNQIFTEIAAEEGNLVLFESWLRHEVALHRGKEPRVSISFNYAWGA